MKCLRVVEWFVAVLCIFLLNCGGGGGDTQPSGAQQKTLFALYVVGSDLESNNSAATSDLLEIVRGLHNQNSPNLQIVIAFGGSQKQNWQGVKYMDKACLIQDAQDGVFGNDICYEATDPNANMGDPATLEAFFTFLKNNYSNYDKKILIFWDHGGAYRGFGWDTNYQSDRLTLTEIKQALSNSGINFDLIGFDACLMASLEVAKVMKPYASYMVASEESEPGHGWNYTPVITYMVQNPDASVVDIAKKMVDEFMNHPDADSGKTLSVIDLSEVDTIVQALDNLLTQVNPTQLSDIQTFGEAVSETRAYGKSPENNIAYSMDLRDFALKVKAEAGGSLPEADALAAAVEQAVVYSRQDGTRPNSYGISIFNPETSQWFSQVYIQQIAASHQWFTFLGQFYTQTQGDTTPPTIALQGTCTQNSVQGYCYQVTDDLVLKDVSAFYVVQDTNNMNLYYVLGKDELDLYQNQPNTYFLESWDGYWVQLCDRGTQSCIIPAGFYYAGTDTGNWIYLSDALLNNQPGIFLMEVDKSTGNVAHHVFIPYDYDSSTGELIISKATYKLSQGDTIVFRWLTYNASTNTFSYTNSQSLTINNAPSFSWVLLANQKFYWLYAEDFKENWAISSIYSVP
ncbi:clostripain-related cysteine peptidase [Hydrogenivirga sp.]